MKTIDFVVRGSAGGLQRGTVSADASNQTIVAGSGQEISINARQSDFASQVRTGDQLVITLSDGRVITIDNFFNDSGAANRLFLSSDGYLNEVSFVDAGQGNLYAQYGPTAEWGKWSPSDELIFLGNSEVAGVPLADADGDVSMLGATLLGGGLGLGGLGAAAAGLGGLAVIGGLAGGGGGGDGTIPPYVNNGDANVIIGGGEPESITITGGGEPGDTVVVTVGEESVTTVIDEEGNFEAVFEGENFPKDGVYDSTVAVTNPNGGETTLEGPSFEIDTTPPEITFTSGTDGNGDFVNEADFDEDVTITGTGEAGATLVVTIDGHSQSTVIAADGSWTVTYDAGTFVAGEYTLPISAVATDSFGNSATFTETLVIDTVTTVTIENGPGGSDGTINAEEAGQAMTVSGMTEPGSTVIVNLGGATSTAVVSADGSWTATFAAGSVAAGTYSATMTATATDAAGNTDSATTSVAVDTEAGLLTIDSTPVEGDDVVNETEASDGVVLTGTADAGATVTVTMEGVSHDVVTDADGNWEAFFSASDVAAGVYTAQITATTTDAAGNVSSATDSVQVDTRVDNLTISANTIAVDNVISGSEIDGSIMVRGTTEVGTTSVIVTMGGQTVTAIVNNNGNWRASFDGNLLETGTYTADIGVTATDAAGNVKTIGATVDVDTEVRPFDFTSSSAGADQWVNAAEASGGIELGGSVEKGSTVKVTFDGTTYNAVVNSAGNWSLTVPESDVRQGAYAADISVTATDRVGNVAVIEDTLSIDTEAPEGPVIASFTRGGDGIRGISIETVMEAGEALDQSVVQVQSNGSITEVDGAQGTNSRGETSFDFERDVPNGSQLIVNSTDAAGNTSGTFLVLDNESAINSVDLTNMALGDYQIENLDLDFAEAASVVIDEASLLALSTNSNTLTIHGSAEDEVIIQDGRADGTETVDGQTFNVYLVGSEGTLLVDQDISVTI